MKIMIILVHSQMLKIMTKCCFGIIIKVVNNVKGLLFYLCHLYQAFRQDILLYIFRYVDGFINTAIIRKYSFFSVYCDFLRLNEMPFPLQE